MKIVIGADHAGFELKQKIKEWLTNNNFEVKDVGNLFYDINDDYPDYAIKVASAVANGEFEKGIIICGSGVGANIVANKHKNVRAAICHDTYSAHQGVEHDNMNVLCLGGRIIGFSLGLEIIKAFAEAKFSNEDRHIRRLKKISKIESK